MISRRFGFTIGMDPGFETLVTMPLYEGSQFEYNMGAWFAVALYMVQIFTAAVRALYFLPFYAMGIFYRRVLEDHDRLPHLLYYALVFLAQYLIILRCGRIPYYTPSRCAAFDMAAYKSNLAYFYAPGGRIFYLVYLTAGLAVPIGMQKLVDHVRCRLRKTRLPA